MSFQFSKSIWVHSIAFGIALFSFNASADFSPPVADECFLEGPVRMRLVGDMDSGRIVGRIGKQNVNWPIFSGLVDSTFKDEPIRLDLRYRHGNYELTGWIKRNWIYWVSVGDEFRGYQRCIPQE